jgi:hypothetical protein
LQTRPDKRDSPCVSQVGLAIWGTSHAERLQCDRTLFPWHEIDVETTTFLQDAEAKLRQEVRTQSHSIVAAGGVLLAIKRRLAHGHFQKFVSNVLGLGIRSAQNYMNAHRAFAETKSEIISPLRPKAIYRLAAPRMPKDEQEEILAALSGPNPDIPAIERRILQSTTKEEGAGEGAAHVLAILQRIDRLLRPILSNDAYTEFCALMTDQAILVLARSLSTHLQKVFGPPAEEIEENH